MSDSVWSDPLMRRRPTPPTALRWRDWWKVLIPSALVAVLAVAGPAVDHWSDDRCPAGTDGPQFACWLEEHGG